MRASLFVIAAAALLTASVPLSGAFAQDVRVEGPGVGVRIGDPDRDHWREERWREHHWRDRVTVGGEGCREVTVRKRMPDGTVVIRRRTVC